MVKQNQSLLSCFGHSANEETALFNKRSTWNRADTIDEKYLEFLAPHSQPYFSRLRPLFSFEVKSLTSLNAFSHVLFRDGVVHLLRFFQRFPEPKGLMSKILIHQNLGPVVPPAWRKSILYYRVQAGERNSQKDNLFLHISFIQFHSDEKAIKNLRETLERISGKIFVVTGLNVLRGEDFLNYDRSYAFDQSHQLFTGLNVEFIDLGAVTSALSLYKHESSFMVFNPYQYWFSDSYLEHHFLNQGLNNLGEEAMSGDFIPLGPHHGMVIGKEGKVCSAIEKELFQELGYPTGDLFSGEPSIDRNIEDYFKVRYTSSAFEKMAFDLACKIGNGLRKES